MGNLLFLLIAVGLSAVGILIAWLRQRPPTTVHRGVDSYTERMRAIAPDRSESRPAFRPQGRPAPPPRRRPERR